MGSWEVRGFACLGFLTRQRVTIRFRMSFGSVASAHLELEFSTCAIDD